jgi:hypothetical protein
VDEGKPVEIGFDHRVLTSAANMGSFSIPIWCDERSDFAPVHKNSNGQNLVKLRADLSHFSMSDTKSLQIAFGGDGNNYYLVPGIIEATFYSASTKYVLLCKGQRCDAVEAEYV